jgi:hypothetical protein
MRLETLYPYWDLIHTELLDEVALFTQEQIEEVPQLGSHNLRQIVVSFAALERFQMGHLVGGHRYDRPVTAEYETTEQLLDLLTATRQITDRVMCSLNAASLKSVRTLPANVELNRPESNVSVAWLIWDVMQHEIRCVGRVKQRFEDQGWRHHRRRR